MSKQRVTKLSEQTRQSTLAKPSHQTLSIDDVVTVNFALGSAKVVVLGSHEVADGDTIYHVKDIFTGHQDFVGSRWIDP